MRIGELAARTGVSIKAVRYYEELGFLQPSRELNGYRSFGEQDVRVVREIRELSEVGISPVNAAPFIECLDTGHEHSDECVSSLAVYRDTIADLDKKIVALSQRRHTLQERLDASAGRTFTTTEESMSDYTELPEGLPAPQDDGAAEHLPGLQLPDHELPTSDGNTVNLTGLGSGRTVVYFYPLTGRPGVDLPKGWDGIPGARGCSTEACDFRDHFEDLRDVGVNHVYGLSSQDPSYQAEVVSRLRLPFSMVSDLDLALADALRLPTFAAPGHERLYARLTLIIRDGRIEHVFYPIFPPNTHAQQVLRWIEQHPA